MARTKRIVRLHASRPERVYSPRARELAATITCLLLFGAACYLAWYFVSTYRSMR